MAVYKADILDIELNTGNIARSFLCHNIGKDDQKADRFGVRCFRDGEPVSLSGVSIQGFMLRPNGSHFHIHGSANTGVSGNEAWVDLPQEAYDYEGQFCLALKLIGGEVTGTIRIIDGMVKNTFVDGAVAPTAAVPTYQEILSVYDQMVAAKAGSVRFDTDQTLTAAQMTQARGNIEAASESDVADLKSALNGGLIVNPADYSTTDYGRLNFVNGPDNTVVRHNYEYASIQVNLDGYYGFEITASSTRDANYTLLKERLENLSGGTSIADKLATGETGRHTVATGQTESIVIPNDAAVAMITVRSRDKDTDNATPAQIKLLPRLIMEIDEKQDRITFDTEPIENSANPVTSGGVFSAIENTEKVVSTGLLPDVLIYTLYESGTINNSTGKNSSNENVVRTSSYIDIGHLYKSVIPGRRIFVRYYDSSLQFLGNGHYHDDGVITHADIVNEMEEDTTPSKATAKFIRITYGNNSKPVTMETIGSLGLATYLYPQAEMIALSGTYTSSFDLYIMRGPHEHQNTIIECISSYTGETQPTIQVFDEWQNTSGAYTQYYASSIYPIGVSNNLYRNAWRVPPRQPTGRDYYKVSVIVPSGTTLTIKSMRNMFDDRVNDSEHSLIIQAHSPSGCGAPFNTLAQVEMAAKLGYKYCIMVPKYTADETPVYVCLHDDESIQATARNPDGSAIADEYKNKAVTTFTYAQLLQFDFGIYRGMAFAGEKIPLLADFFAICAKNGVHPVLSVHPNLAGHWANIRILAEKYGVLKTLNIKAPYSMLTYPMAEMLNDVESYALVKSGSFTIRNCITRMNDLKNATYRPTDETIPYPTIPITVPCGVECTSAELDETGINSILNAGLFAGCNSYGQSAGRMKELISLGVTRFTEDYNCSVGLNW